MLSRQSPFWFFFFKAIHPTLFASPRGYPQRCILPASKYMPTNPTHPPCFIYFVKDTFIHRQTVVICFQILYL